MPRITAILFVAAVVVLPMGLIRPVLGAAQEATPVADCPVTTPAENEAIARRWHEDVINQGNLSALDEFVARDVIHHAGTFPDGEGIEAVRAVLDALLTGFPDVQHTIEDVIAEDDRIVIRWVAVGTHDGDFQGYAPTGKRVAWTGINIFRMECGRIIEEWSEVDGLGRLRELGVLAESS